MDFKPLVFFDRKIRSNKGFRVDRNIRERKHCRYRSVRADSFDRDAWPRRAKQGVDASHVLDAALATESPGYTVTNRENTATVNKHNDGMKACWVVAAAAAAAATAAGVGSGNLH